MKRRSLILILLMLSLLGGPQALAEKNVKVKVKYRSHTSFDFAGDRVDGKIKGAAVFYIFQRKRSQGHQVITPPPRFGWYHQPIIADIKKALPQ